MAKLKLKTASFTPLLSDGSSNDYWGVVWFKSLTDKKHGNADGNRKKVVLERLDEDEDLPNIARIAAIHTLTTGDLTVADFNCHIGVSDARWAQDSIFDASSTPPVKRKWNSFVGPGTGYTEQVIATRHWFSSSAIAPGGMAGAQLVALLAATGVQVKTNQQFQAIMPVVPIP